ncbi:MAG: copper-translocating P-type ATPase [Ignavibacteriales bacterium]|nr:MAG: copper-translocating P-type ATPase [Ignavibacteriales bacterium]
MKKINVPVEGMTCASCVTRVEKIIGGFEGVKNVNVNLATEHVTFELEHDNINLDSIAKAVEDYGYKLKLNPNTQNDSQNIIQDSIELEKDKYYEQIKKDFFLALVLTLPIFIISMLFDYSFFQNIWSFSADTTHKILLILTTPIIFISGKRFYTIFWTNLKHFSFEMNSLVAIGTGAAYGYSVIATLFPSVVSIHDELPHVYFETAGVIITLILMGKLLEHNAKQKTNSAIKKLIELRPKTAKVLINNKETVVNISDLKVGDVIVIKPGDKIPADGIIIWGNSSVDESMITGESLPVEKTIESKVIGGTINKNGSFNFKVTEIGDNTVLAQIIRLVEQAQASKPPIQKLVDKIASVFVPVVIVIALITFLVWLFIGGHNSFSQALVNFVAVLIIACPCALGLATPTAIIVGSGLGASNGILIRNGESLELAQNISTIIFDKTGTITEGKPIVSEMVINNISEDELILLSASLESKSEHPLALAIVEKAKSKNISLLQPETFKNLSGFGLTGIVNNRSLIIGNLNLMNEYSIKTNAMNEHYDKLIMSGKTIVFVGVDGELKGLISIEDKLKVTSAEAIKELGKMKIKTVMLTGDNSKTARLIADKVGITDFRSEVLPDEKANIVKEYQSKGEVVAMVGDGINDSPALAQADVGIAIGTGTDVAIETAQITLVQGNLLSVAKAINLSKNTIKTIKQNLFWAFIYNTVLIPLAAFGMLNPMIGALAMSLSSVSVVSNSLRLKRAKI